MSARYLPDGTCELVDLDGRATSWPSLVACAEAWLDEWRRSEHGPASEFVDDMTDEGAEGVVTVLTVLAERAADVPDELAWVGAGPLEDLLSHSPNGVAVLDEVELASRKHRSFRVALGHVWVGRDVAPEIRSRLIVLGARDLSASRD